jgi:uncharacterized membrane protein
MSWILVALIAPFLYSLANHADKYLLSKHFENEGVGGLMIFTGVIAGALLPFLFFVAPDSLQLEIGVILALLATGVLSCLAIVLYLELLTNRDASYIVPFWQLAPVFSYVLGVWLLDEHIDSDKLLGGAVTLLGAFTLSLSLEGSRFKMDRKVFVWMGLSSLLVALESTLFRKFGLDLPFWSSIFWNQAGMLLFALICFAIPKPRRDFLAVFRGKGAGTATAINLGEQVTETAGSLVASYSLLLAPVAAVTFAAYTSQPVFVFLTGLLLTFIFPKLVKEDLRAKIIVQKIGAMVIMAVGVYFVGV